MALALGDAFSKLSRDLPSDFLTLMWEWVTFMQCLLYSQRSPVLQTCAKASLADTSTTLGMSWLCSANPLRLAFLGNLNPNFPMRKKSKSLMCLGESTNQPTYVPTYHPTLVTNQPTNQPNANQPTYWPASRPTNQPAHPPTLVNYLPPNQPTTPNTQTKK